MNLTTKFAAELARRLDATEQSSADERVQQWLEPELDGLVKLARKMRALPAPDPDQTWLDRSKQQLLMRFDTIQGSPRASLPRLESGPA